MYKCICKKRDGSLFCYLNFGFAAEADRTRSRSKNRFRVSFRYIQFQTSSPIQLSLCTHSASSQQDLGSLSVDCLSLDHSVVVTGRSGLLGHNQNAQQTNKQKKTHKHYRRCRAYWSHAELHQPTQYRYLLRICSVTL